MLFLCLKIFKLDKQVTLNGFFPSWYDIMRFEEVVVFMCGLMKNPTALIHHMCNKFNEMNTHYLTTYYKRVPDEEKETKLKRFGKIAVKLDFFHLVRAESRSQLPWLPLQNPHFNWFDHLRDDQHGIARDISCVYIPSEYYNFQNLKEPILSHNIQEHEQLPDCSIVVDNPHPHVINSLLLTCAIISQHQSVVNLCLFNLIIQNTTINDIFKLGPNAEFLTIEDCILPSNIMACLFQQISFSSALKGIRLKNSTFEEPGKSLMHLSESIQRWGDNTKLEYLVIYNCSLPLDQCSSILQSLSRCKHLTYLNLSDNMVGNGGKHLAESIRNWGINPPLTLLYLHNCGLNEQDCVALFQSLLECCNLKEINVSRNNIGEAARYLVKVIQKLSSYGKLEMLYLSDCSIPEDQCTAILDSLSLCKQLTCLDLSNSRIQNEKYLVQIIRNCGGLQKLYLQKCSIPEQCWGEIFNSLGTCSSLTDVELSFNIFGESAYHLVQSIRQWGHNPPLQVLDLYGCFIPDKGSCELISTLFSCTRLTSLKLAGSHLCENGLHLKRYLDTIPDTLESLCLDGCSIPLDVTRRIISVLSRCKNLYHMSLPGNTLTGQLSQFGPHPPLEHLDLSDTALNKDDIDHLTDIIKKNKVLKLRELYLIGNSLHSLKKETEALLDTCINYHSSGLTVFLNRNNLTEEFQKEWTLKSEGTKIKLDLDMDAEYKSFGNIE